MTRAAAALCALLLVAPVAAGDFTGGVVVSSSAATGKPASIEWHAGYRKPEGSHERGSIGIGAGLPEGKTLECSLWGAGGAVVGSLAGPVGAAVGGSVGILAGLVVSRVFTPKNGAVR